MILSSKSKKLISHFIKQSKRNYIHATKQTDTIFTELYDKLLKSYIFVNRLGKDSFFHITSKRIAKSSQITIPNGINLHHLPEDIKHRINEHSATEITYSFNIGERKIKIIFTVEEARVNMQTYNKYVESIVMWLHIVNQYASLKCSSGLIVYFYFTYAEKHLPKTKDAILGETNVNTAFTTSCPKDAEIVVYRKEEWFKVLIHESFHSFGLDFSSLNNADCMRYILKIFPVESKVNLYESYTEFWAETMNILFCSFFSLKHKNNINEFLDNVEILLNLERSYSFFQLVKVLNHMGLTYKDLYSNTKNSDELRKKFYKENTNVLSYYIIKTILINDYQSFLLWCKKSNPNILQFKQTQHHIIEYCRYIEKKYKTKSMLESIEHAEKLMKTRKTDKYLLTNMRMSICELG